MARKCVNKCSPYWAFVELNIMFLVLLIVGILLCCSPFQYVQYQYYITEQFSSPQIAKYHIDQEVPLFLTSGVIMCIIGGFGLLILFNFNNRDMKKVSFSTLKGKHVCVYVELFILFFGSLAAGILFCILNHNYDYFEYYTNQQHIFNSTLRTERCPIYFGAGLGLSIIGFFGLIITGTVLFSSINNENEYQEISEIQVPCDHPEPFIPSFGQMQSVQVVPQHL
ncbi:Hypothetical_protein [Hexamita inflata]|uniref:Hypothetical_protein n=1 Tax=Hexamita inflata TaxID=28002 RepID=A0AA86U1C6_9EUKA|nr:Hypothetical protein HINF_LOCUS24076 [Hexamita inflata]